MPDPLFRYQLDTTGISVNNKVSGEVHTLNNQAVRALAPIYGPFFTDRLFVYDHTSNRQLVRNIDYVPSQLVNEASLQFGKEICSIILIVNQEIGSRIRIDYQVLGGLYQNEANSLISLYETALLDNRDVPWTNILEKPYGFNPVLHQHLVEELVGFGPHIAELERIRMSILLSGIPSIEVLANWVQERLDSFEDRLPSRASSISIYGNSILPGQTFPFYVLPDNLISGRTYYWTIRHITTGTGHFFLTSGLFEVGMNPNNILIPTRNVTIHGNNRIFVIQIREGSPSGPVISESGQIEIIGTNNLPSIDIYTPMRMNLSVFHETLSDDPESFIFESYQ